jgi:hypothetical protein
LLDEGINIIALLRLVLTDWRRLGLHPFHMLAHMQGKQGAKP